MSAVSLLVKSFQVWMRSPMGRQVAVQAEKALAPQIAKVGAMVADELVLSAKAVSGVAAKSVAQTAERSVARAVAPVAEKAAEAVGRTTASAAAKTAGKQVMTRGEKLIAARRVAMNSLAGDRREAIVKRFLASKFPAAKGFSVHPEQYLRDASGQIARDAAGHGRRLDFVVFNGEKAVKTIEVTSETASKTAQAAKELAIRNAGGRYLIHPETGKLVKLAANQTTDTLRLR